MNFNIDDKDCAILKEMKKKRKTVTILNVKFCYSASKEEHSY